MTDTPTTDAVDAMSHSELLELLRAQRAAHDAITDRRSLRGWAPFRFLVWLVIVHILLADLLWIALAANS